ncbi:MAG TPA: hypothetical protein PKY50_18470 [Candidatus Competibacter sp.]|nr:hypothetical protein [Candidatus Competibacter sp.]
MTPDICVQAGVDFEMVSSQQAVMRIRKFPGGHGSVAFAGKSMGGGGWMIDYALLVWPSPAPLLIFSKTSDF